ncbi:MAG: hypoxanthine phosphoribosyltransferase [Bacteroidales bacterium]|nr:hypoxanthine phosphoribosyltransferase [Bacteroidales bacterium]
MTRIKLNNKEFDLYINYYNIIKAISLLATEIERDYKCKKPLFLVILNGAFMFAGELFKRVNIDCEISFIKYSSYKNTKSTGKIHKIIGLNEDIANKNIIIIEDIIETGTTIESLIKDIKKLKPKSVAITTLLHKPLAFKSNFKIDYLGLNITDDFIIGFGLDYNGLGRNYSDIYKIVNNNNNNK